MNITLIGMAGAGKSHIGKRLAERAELDFVDIDDVLEAQHGRTIQSLLEGVGEQKYLDFEARALIDATRDRDNLLISPGGSIIYRHEGMDHVKDISTIVYLQVPYEIIEERKRDAAPRAVIGLGRKTLRELYDERHPMYLSDADHTIDMAQLDDDAAVKMIVALLGL